MGKKQYVYLATNGDDYEWSVEAIFATEAEAQRYVDLFGFAKTVERWEVGVSGMPTDPEVTTWICRFSDNGTEMRCHRGALSHGSIGMIDGWKWANRGTAVYARTEQEAHEKALAIIEDRDGPHATWGDPQWGKQQ